MIFIKMEELIILGLTKGNFEKFNKGNPIFKEFHLKMTFDKILIITGENKIDILNKLEELGLKIENYMRESAEENPS